MPSEAPAQGLAMEVVESRTTQNPLEDATVYINCAVYENGMLEVQEEAKLIESKTIDLCADKKIHFIEKSIERSRMAKDEDNNEYGYMNGDVSDSIEDIKKALKEQGTEGSPTGGYTAKTRVFQTQEIRIVKTRKPLAPKAVVVDNQKNILKDKTQTLEQQQGLVQQPSSSVTVVKEVVIPKNKESVQESVVVEPVKVTSSKSASKPGQQQKVIITTTTTKSSSSSSQSAQQPKDQVDSTKEAEVSSTKHKQEVTSTAEEPPRKKRYLCRDIVIPAYGHLYKNEGLTTPSVKLHLDARSWALGNTNNADANKIAEIVYTSFRPRVHKDRHVRLLFPPPYHPKDPEVKFNPEVQVNIVPPTPMEQKTEEIAMDTARPSGEDEENEDDSKLSKRGRKKRNWFQRMWRNLRNQFRANEALQNRDA